VLLDSLTAVFFLGFFVGWRDVAQGEGWGRWETELSFIGQVIHNLLAKIIFFPWKA